MVSKKTYNKKLFNYILNTSKKECNLCYSYKKRNSLIYMHFKNSYDFFVDVDKKIIDFSSENNSNEFYEDFIIDVDIRQPDVVSDFLEFQFKNSNLFESYDLKKCNLMDFICEVYDCKDLKDIDKNDIYKTLNYDKPITMCNVVDFSEEIENEIFLKSFPLKENFSKAFYLNFWAFKETWFFCLTDNFYQDITYSKTNRFLKNYKKEVNLEEIEYYYTYLRLSVDKKYDFKPPIDIYMYSVNKNLNFINNANFLKNFYFSDFAFDLTKNLTIKQEVEFNNSIFFLHLKFLKILIC
jgi:hypothetical protein